MVFLVSVYPLDSSLIISGKTDTSNLPIGFGTRARNDARIAARKAKQHLHSFLLRNDFIYNGKTKWIKSYFNWLAQLKMKHPVQQIAFQEYVDAIHECNDRIIRLDEQILKAADEWRWASTVKALQALRGVSLLTAVNMVAEVGDFSRFQNPKELMAYSLATLFFSSHSTLLVFNFRLHLS